jgi:hypothetical protein
MAGPDDRFSQPDDKIDAIPGILTSNNISLSKTGGYNGNMDLFLPTAQIKPRMEEAQTFQAKDKEASEWMTKFVVDADNGFRAYHGTARNHGQDYIDSDQVGASFFQNIDEKKPPESFFGDGVTSDIYA